MDKLFTLLSIICWYFNNVECWRGQLSFGDALSYATRYHICTRNLYPFEDENKAHFSKVSFLEEISDSFNILELAWFLMGHRFFNLRYLSETHPRRPHPCHGHIAQSLPPSSLSPPRCPCLYYRHIINVSSSLLSLPQPHPPCIPHWPYTCHRNIAPCIPLRLIAHLSPPLLNLASQHAP